MIAMVKASNEWLTKVDHARRAKGWRKQDESWAMAANVSISTLKRFWSQLDIGQESFAAICKSVEMDYQLIIAPPKVFISYSHDSGAHSDRVLTLANRLRADGVDCNIDQYEAFPPEGWPKWMENQINAADFVLVICTQIYYERFQGVENLGYGLGVTWEGAIINDEFYRILSKNTKFIPILFSSESTDSVPINLRKYTHYRVDIQEDYENLFRLLTAQPSPKKVPLGKSQEAEANEIRLPKAPIQERLQLLHSIGPNFFAYDEAWVGRDGLVQDLSQRIRQDNCRLLVLVGITGIGKTALGERLAVEVSDWFGGDWSQFHQENFDDEQQSSDFASVAARWLENWGELITVEDSNKPEQLLSRLVRHLNENRYLVQIDSLENILQGNEKEGWNEFKDDWWVKFFDSYLKAVSCQSFIILTSQDLPAQIESIGARSRNFWYCQLLSGLEKTEQIALFEKTLLLDISFASEDRLFLERIGVAYEGHPLALRIIAGEIKNRPFEGNIVAYWHKYGNEVEEVEKTIAEVQEGKLTGVNDKWQLDRFTKTLRRNVQSRLDKTFLRLRKDAKWAYVLLCEASIYHCPVPESFWLSHLEDWNRNELEQKTALDTLRDRYLLEEVVEHSTSRYLLRQNNLIRCVSLKHQKILDQLIEDG
jgi:SEFIR domain